MMVIGRIAGAFGVKGWVKVQTFTQSVDTLIGFPTWWLAEAAGWRQTTVEDAAVHGRAVIAKLSGVNDRDAAAQLRGHEVAVPRDQLPASGAGEYYWADLIGIAVSTVQGVPLGRVAKLV